VTGWNETAPDDTAELDLSALNEPEPEDDEPTEPGPNPYADGAQEIPDA